VSGGVPADQRSAAAAGGLRALVWRRGGAAARRSKSMLDIGYR
jgi:hypothetical protein